MRGDSYFVFHDPTGRRWARIRRFLRVGTLFLLIAAVLFVVSVISSPQLPALGLPVVEHLAAFREVPSIIRGEKTNRNTPFRAKKEARTELRKDARNVRYVRSASPVVHPRKAAATGATKPMVFGFYVNWDKGSIVSLRLNLQHLTHLVPEWLTLKNAQGDLDDESDPTVITIAADANLPILAMVTNFREGWRGADLSSVLNNLRARTDLVDNIYANLKEHKFAGVNIDFEQLPRKDRAQMTEFMRQLHERLKPEGFLITQSVPVDDEAYDLKALAEWNDYLVPMVYDEHYQSGEPGPVASSEWFGQQLDKLASAVPPEKVVIGMGAYGYDWRIGGTGAAEVTFGDVIAAAVSRKAKIEWDGDEDNPVLRYGAGADEHEVWFLDAVSALNAAIDIRDAGFRGYAVWRLGAEDPGMWTALKPETWQGEQFEPAQLFRLTSQKSVQQYGEGEILRIVETPHDGKRNVWREQDGSYTEEYQQYPSYYVLESVGRPPDKAVAITFDDGPDPKYTPRILDVLKEKKAPATFFVVGVEAEQSPGLIRRMYAEGHEIGSHTYSHPNVATISAERTRLELGATQRIIEHAIGVSTILFRPPYNADSEPQTPEEIVPILRAQDAGYITVAERIDPRDWQKGTTADAILEEVENERDNGHIILLHDGGGDRTATIEALPRLIDRFRQDGYRFALVSDLMGKQRADVMPPPSKDEMRWAQIEGQAFDFKSNFIKLAGLLFLAAIYLTVARSVLYGAMAVVQKVRARRRVFQPDFRPPVSVVIAAYNEEKVILRTVESVLENGYGDLEVIVVDDGSKDATLRVLREAFGGDERVRVFTQTNQGKSAALNHAIEWAPNDILVALDADTIFRRGTIEKLVRHFSDARVGAVSGNARVGNRKKWITRFQSIEYIYGFNLDRRALDLLNAITVVPGAVGAWRRSLILEAGGFRPETLAEDTDLTLAIRRRGYAIRYEEEAVAYTEAPEDTRSLARQRFRWAFGTLQAVWKHRDATFDPQYGSLAFVALPSVWIFQILLAALSPFAEISMLVGLFAGNWRVVLGYYLAFFVLELLTGLAAYALEGEKPKDLVLLFFQRVYYRQLMHYVLAKSLLYAFQGRVVGWGKLERRASVESV